MTDTPQSSANQNTASQNTPAQDTSTRLAGKAAIVTGGGQGVGRGISLGLAESGAAVLLVGRKMHKLERVAEEIRSGPLDHDTRFPYHPHVTLAQDVDDIALDLALDIGATVEASWIVPGFRLDRIDPSGIYSSMALFDFDASGH